MLPRRNNFNKIKQGSGRRKFFYSKKSYKNPFFRRQSASRRSSRDRVLSKKNRLIVVAGAASFIVLAWLLFFSNLFKINKIEVSGVSDDRAGEVESIAGALAADKFFGRNNLLLFSTGRFKTALNEKYYLQSLNIKKSLPHTLKISLREMQPAAIWLQDGKYFQIDGQGDIINQVDPLNISRQSLPLIENLTGSKIDGRKISLDQAAVEYITGLFNEFKDQKHGFEVEKFIVDQDTATVKMAVMDGPKIYFNVKDNAAAQASRLDLIIKEKLKDSFKSKKYIDLRYSGNIYIK